MVQWNKKIGRVKIFKKMLIFWLILRMYDAMHKEINNICKPNYFLKFFSFWVNNSKQELDDILKYLNIRNI